MRSALALALAVAAAGCGDDTDDSRVRDLQAAARAVDAAATAYRADAADVPDAAACTAVHHAYDAEVRPMVEWMLEVAPGMDAHMAELGEAGHADMTCVARAMRDELDRHAGAACASQGDMGANAAEAATHAGRMIAWSEHEHVRADEMGWMMDGGMGGGMHGGGMGGPYPDWACPAP